ncbi:leukocyte-associated immunoglobulin-like receptor 1 [Onychomys torridus]|uniref:leukocyte-associated immunoglobulin-like receptor 1 n=1 Tax=Onychomys torridus TaxID=38674 RepID=UPI00167F41A8|nr:leukocyte-associated immunoglobulin-like receptor 1 [Onychomys torridus]XP_036023681.1 leukocyte-associated immunoglobulin-like receptor 1 [Onychomys torridus]XP_036023690.1 leukocyte-associated immunoglobulin-like receptor 1 [Onychomys torridus]XP_036023699.1 leukocyte-associated immunoglobulin-like receptor 1 [Onychomys torridus]
MSLHPAIVLALVLCLGQTINTQEGSLLSPFISAEPGLVIPQGHSVTFVCSNPGGHDTFRLEKGGHAVMDKENTQPSMTEVRFQLGPVNESTSGGYSCLYLKWGNWSPRSETLELMVTREDVTQAPDPGPTVNSDTSWLKTNGIYILVGVSVVFLLCLLLLLLFCFHSHRQKKQGLPNSKSQQQRPQERLSPAPNGLERTPDIVRDDKLPEDRRTETWTPAAGGLQEVTYAQLDHHALTQRTAGAVTPQSTDTMTESSTYAAIIGR